MHNALCIVSEIAFQRMLFLTNGHHPHPAFCSTRSCGATSTLLEANGGLPPSWKPPPSHLARQNGIAPLGGRVHALPLLDPSSGRPIPRLEPLHQHVRRWFRARNRYLFPPHVETCKSPSLPAAGYAITTSPSPGGTPGNPELF